MYGVSGIFCGDLLIAGGWGFLLQSSLGGPCSFWGAGGGRLLPLGSVVVAFGRGGVGGGTLRGGCGDDRRGGAGGGTGKGVTTGAVL